MICVFLSLLPLPIYNKMDNFDFFVQRIIHMFLFPFSILYLGFEKRCTGLLHSRRIYGA